MDERRITFIVVGAIIGGLWAVVSMLSKSGSSNNPAPPPTPPPDEKETGSELCGHEFKTEGSPEKKPTGDDTLVEKCPDREANVVLPNDTCQSQSAPNFWHMTWLAWKSGAIAAHHPETVTDAGVPFADFEKGADATHPAMKMFSSKFRALPSEFLCGYDGQSNDRPNYVLTSQRLFARGKRDKDYTIIRLENISELSPVEGWTGMHLNVVTADGAKYSFQNLSAVPSKDYVSFVRSNAKNWSFFGKEPPDANSQSPPAQASAPSEPENAVRQPQPSGGGRWELVPMSGLVAGIAFAIALEIIGAAGLLVAGLAYLFCIQNRNLRFDWAQKLVATVMMLAIGTYWRQALDFLKNH